MSRRPEYPSGPSSGRADFIPRKASILQGPTATNEIEYLYAEKTILTASGGLKLQGSQQYIYRYDKPDDKLAVYFAKRDGEATLDNLFHQINLEPPEPSNPWKAKSFHFCPPDNYEICYTFYFKGADLERWMIEYEVKGPNKDYTMQTSYTRK